MKILELIITDERWRAYTLKQLEALGSHTGVTLCAASAFIVDEPLTLEYLEKYYGEFTRLPLEEMPRYSSLGPSLFTTIVDARLELGI